MGLYPLLVLKTLLIIYICVFCPIKDPDFDPTEASIDPLEASIY